MRSLPLGRMENPARGILDLVAAAAAAVAVVFLLVRSQPSITVPAIVYGIALIAMFLTSASYHSIRWSEGWKARLQKADHSLIYILVAGTFTPLLAASLSGGTLGFALVCIWAIAGLGVLAELGGRRYGNLILAGQVISGLLLLVPAWLMLFRSAAIISVLVIVGGTAYLLGTLAFVNDRPRLFPGVFSHHEFFHVMVILAASAHFVAVWNAVT